MSAIDDVKARIDIVDLVGDYVTLQRAGRSFKALCPFHSERTPSFIVTPDRQTWHCFGACSTGGDIFSFVMKREGVEFIEALRILAQRAGVSLGERRAPEEDERRDRLVQANEAAAAFFHNALLHSKAAAPGRAYLESRGLDLETIELFQLGHSPDSWDGLKSHLTERGFAVEELVTAGLLVEGERGAHDRFRGRLMFPIRDERGRVVGFGGRVLAPADGGAKYINTSQTPMFDKGALLYALDRAKDAVRREGKAVVVEGYMDAIAAHQHGISNVVASMGTALTERQIRTLERLRCTVLLALDADAAGIEATLRALQEAEAAGAARAGPTNPAELEDEEFSQKLQEWSRDALKRAAVNFFVVPLSGKDPDEMIRADRSAWDDAIAGAKPFTDHVFEIVAGRKDLSQPRQRSELLRELLPVVRLIDEPVFRAHYVQRLARLAQVGEDVVRGELRRQPARRTRADAAPEALALRTNREPGEEFCLALLLRHQELRPDGTDLSPEIFSLGEHRAIYSAWLETPDLEELRQTLPEEVHPHVDHILDRDLPFLEGTRLREALQDCVRRIGLRRLSAAKQASAAALAEPDVQPYMSEAVHEAVVLREALVGEPTAGTPSSPPSAHASELAIRLVQDDELGRRLHQPSSQRPSAPQTDESPQDEGEP